MGIVIESATMFDKVKQVAKSVESDEDVIVKEEQPLDKEPLDEKPDEKPKKIKKGKK